MTIELETKRFKKIDVTIFLNTFLNFQNIS